MGFKSRLKRVRDEGTPIERRVTAVSSIVGGTASVISGGKFANGASTSASLSLLSSAAEAVANKHRRPEPDISIGVEIPDFEVLEIEPLRDVAVVDETLVVPQAPPNGIVKRNGTLAFKNLKFNDLQFDVTSNKDIR